MRRKTLMTLIILILITTSTLFSFFSTISLSSDVEEQITLQVEPRPLIDVVLTKAKSETDVTNFKTDLLQALQNQNIDTSLVNIMSVEAETVNIAAGFKWQEDENLSIGSIDISPDGKNVTMIGNRKNPGKNAIWIIPEENQEQEFSFSYDIDYGDSFNAAGMLLRVQQSGNTLTGYMLSFNNTS